MSGFSDAYEILVLDHFTGNTPWAQPTNWWVSLWVGDPDDGGAEVTGTGYARKDASFGAAGAGGAANDEIVNYGTSGGDWGTPTYFGIHTLVEGGALMASGLIGTPGAIPEGIAVTYAVGTLTLVQE